MKKVTTIIVSVALLVLGSSGAAFATTLSKTFEFGPGLQYSTSVVDKFTVPCGRQVRAVIKFKRLGPAGTSNDVPIVIEFRQPDTAPGQEGPIVESKSIKATTTEQTVAILSSAAGSVRGCSLPWRIRVKHGNSGPSPVPIFGTSRIEFDDSRVSVTIPAIGSLLKGATKTVNFGDSAGFKQGTISVIPNWSHEIFGQDVGLNYIKLRFQLIDPNGTVVATAEGYARDAPLTPRAGFSFLVANCTSGQWKLRVTNLNANDDVRIDAPHIGFFPGCTLNQ